MPGCSALRCNRRGVSAIEFALSAPLLIVLVTSTMEVSELVRARMKVNHAAGGLAKIVAQQTGTVSAGTSGKLGDLCTGAALDMLPLPTASFGSVVTSVTRTTSALGVATTKQDWETDTSCPTSVPALGPVAAVPAAGAYMNAGPNDSVILVKASYTYRPGFRLILPASMTLTATAAARPRTGTTIACGNC